MKNVVVVSLESHMDFTNIEIVVYSEISSFQRVSSFGMIYKTTIQIQAKVESKK